MAPTTEMSEQQQIYDLCNIIFQITNTKDESGNEDTQSIFAYGKTVFQSFESSYPINISNSEKILILQNFIVSQLDINPDSADLSNAISLLQDFISVFKNTSHNAFVTKKEYSEFLKQRKQLLQKLRSSLPTEHPIIKNIMQNIINEIEKTIDTSALSYDASHMSRARYRLFKYKNEKQISLNISTSTYNSSIHAADKLLKILTVYDNVKTLSISDKAELQRQTVLLHKLRTEMSLSKKNTARQIFYLIKQDTGADTSPSSLYKKILVSKFLPSKGYYYPSFGLSLEELTSDDLKMELSKTKFPENLYLEIIARCLYNLSSIKYIQDFTKAIDNHTNNDIAVIHILKEAFLSNKHIGNPDKNTYVSSLILYGLYNEADSELETLSVTDKKIIFDKIISEAQKIGHDYYHTSNNKNYDYECKVLTNALNYTTRHIEEIDYETTGKNLRQQLFIFIGSIAETPLIKDEYIDNLIKLITLTKSIPEFSCDNFGYISPTNTIAAIELLLKRLSTSKTVDPEDIRWIRNQVASKFISIFEKFHLNSNSSNYSAKALYDHEISIITDVTNSVFSVNPDILSDIIASGKIRFSVLNHVLKVLSKSDIAHKLEDVNPFLIIAKEAKNDSFDLFFTAFIYRDYDHWKDYWSKIANSDSSIIIYLCLNNLYGDLQRKKQILDVICKDSNVLKKVGANLFKTFIEQHESLNPELVQHVYKVLCINKQDTLLKSTIPDMYKLWEHNPDVFTQKHFYNLNAHDIAKAEIAKKATRESYMSTLVSSAPNITEQELKTSIELDIYLIILKKFLDEEPKQSDSTFVLWNNLVKFCKLDNFVAKNKAQSIAALSFNDFKEEIIKTNPTFIQRPQSINDMKELMDESKYNLRLAKIINVLFDTTSSTDNENYSGVGHYSDPQLRDFIRYCALLVTENIKLIGESKTRWSDRLGLLYELGYEEQDKELELLVKAHELQHPNASLLQLSEQKPINEKALSTYNRLLMEYQNRLIEQFVLAIDLNIGTTKTSNGGYTVSCLSGIYTRFMKNVFEVHHASPLINRNVNIEKFLKEKLSAFVMEKFKILSEKSLFSISKDNKPLLDQYDSLFSINESTWPEIYSSGYAADNDAATMQRASATIEHEIKPSRMLIKDMDILRTALLEECFGEKSKLLSDLVQHLPVNMRHELDLGEKEYISYLTRHLFQDDQFMLHLASKLQSTTKESVTQDISYYQRFITEVAKEEPKIRNLKEYLKNAIIDVLIAPQGPITEEEKVGLRNAVLDAIEQKKQLDSFNKCLASICSVKYNTVIKSMFDTSEKHKSASVVEFLKSFSKNSSVDSDDKEKITALLRDVLAVEKILVARNMPI